MLNISNNNVLILKAIPPLHHECFKGHIEIVEYFIEYCFEIDPKDKCECTPLHFASYYGKTDVIKYSLSKGSNKNAKDTDGKTPLELFPH